MNWRVYDADRDRDAVQRIWYEVAWLDPANGDYAKGLDLYLQHGAALVADIHDEAECLVVTAPGTINHGPSTLPMTGVMAVTTGRVGRRQGLAARLTARLVAQAALDGSLVAGLSTFEQGFYNRLGFGNAAYDTQLAVDPSRLAIKAKPRPPHRLSAKDYAAVHANRVACAKTHGAVSFDDPAITHARILWEPNTFGLGYFDGPGGALSHHVWFSTTNVETGPYRTVWMAHSTPEQLQELLALLTGLSDQVYQVYVEEPFGVCLQDLVDRPFHHQSTTRRAKYDSFVRAMAYFQYRLLNIPKALECTEIPSADVRFNLELQDPIVDYLGEDIAWPGVGGNYVVTLGTPCHAEPGEDAALPTLTASVNAFTRLWLGAQSARGLFVTDEFFGPAALIHALDEAIRLPTPRTLWDF